MQRKQFYQLAEAINEANRNLCNTSVYEPITMEKVKEEYAKQIASVCAKNNEQFKKGKFLEACNL